MRQVFLIAGILLLFSCTSTTELSTPVGMLKTRDYIVVMYAGNNGPLYTVQTLEGEILNEELEIQSMVALYPDLEGILLSDPDWAALDQDYRTPSSRDAGI